MYRSSMYQSTMQALQKTAEYIQPGKSNLKKSFTTFQKLNTLLGI